MMRRARLVLALVLVGAAGATSSIAAILQRHHLSDGTTGVFVWDFDAARLVYANAEDTLLAPASNMKLVTTLTALQRWGPDHCFKTELYGPDVPVYQGVIYGDLYLKGYGDPSLSSRYYQRRVFHFATASFEAFARRLRTLGVRKVRGSVLGDESYFDALRGATSWTPSVLTECGPLSALTGDESLQDGGRVKDPAVYAAKLLTGVLRARGITVTGRPGAGTVPATAHLLKREFSAPLRTLLQHMDKESDNFFAETLLKGLGREFGGAGSTAAGAQVAAATLTAVGLSPDSYRLYDGSGLSYLDRLTALDLARILGAARQQSAAKVFYNALAIAGVDGTLEERMRGTAAQGNAHAKTGTLAISVCLSGYVTTADDRDVGYAMLVNGSSVNWYNATSAQDEIVEMLAGASLPGTHLARISPTTRQIPASAAEAVNPVGGYLQPVVQP